MDWKKIYYNNSYHKRLRIEKLLTQIDKIENKIKDEEEKLS